MDLQQVRSRRARLQVQEQSLLNTLNNGGYPEELHPSVRHHKEDWLYMVRGEIKSCNQTEEIIILEEERIEAIWEMIRRKLLDPSNPAKQMSNKTFKALLRKIIYLNRKARILEVQD